MSKVNVRCIKSASPVHFGANEKMDVIRDEIYEVDSHVAASLIGGGFCEIHKDKKASKPVKGKDKIVTENKGPGKTEDKGASKAKDEEK
jgi:hypothetical protein